LCRVAARALECVGGPPEEVSVECLRYELEKREDSRGTDGGEGIGGPGEEEVEEADSYGVALVV